MPFELEKGMECLERAGIKHKENVYFEPPFYCEYGTILKLGRIFMPILTVYAGCGKNYYRNNVLFGPM